MFDIGWSELLVIGVVLIVVVGPKDLPRMLRTFGRTTSQMRKMAGDFRKQFDEALREAELDEVREAARDLKALDPTKDIRKAMSPMKAVGDEIRSSLKAATKAPEPKIPSATAPATVSEPVSTEAIPTVVAAGMATAAVAPSVIGTTEMQPARMSSHWAGTEPAAPASAAPDAPLLNGSGAHSPDKGADAGADGDVK